MAYSARSVSFPVAEGFSVTVTEIDAGSSSEAAVRVPVRGTIVRARSRIVSGTGTRTSLQIGRAPGWAPGGFDEVYSPGTLETDAIPYYAPNGVLYVRNNVDVGNNNEIRTEILIRAEGLVGG